ncbi:MAG: aromatic ring-hydroxylating dioxygenase subunit alpha [Geminicoccaceae bacterium]
MNDPVIWNQWHVVGIDSELKPSARLRTRLLDRQLTLERDSGGQPSATLEDDRKLPTFARYGFIWTTLGEPVAPLFPVPEVDEPDRVNVVTGSVAVRASAPRCIENFLDMGHFPFVHTGLLGEEPHTEVKDYKVEIDETRDEVIATECQFYQPRAAAASSGGARVEYIYRVPHPYCSVLYKSCPFDTARFDIVAMFAQPMSEEHTFAHTLMSIVDDRSSRTDIRHFQLSIFGQDKPILENQRPRRLPLDPRAETPIRADRSSIFYRRWLRAKNVAYGTIPAGT